MPEKKIVTRYDIEQWLDMQIEARRLQNIPLVIEEHDDGIDDKLVNCSRTNDIHLNSDAIRYIAKKLELDIWVKSRKCDEYPYEIGVIYKGEVFIGIESEAEYKERGAVV